MVDKLIQEEDGHGRLYWAGVNVYNGIKGFIKRHKIMALIMLIVTFLLRAVWHPAVIFVRQYSYVVLFMIIMFAMAKVFKRAVERRNKLIVALIMVIGLSAFGVSAFFKFEPHKYLSLYYYYRFVLEKSELNELPVTDYERVHPQNSVYTQAKEAVSETETITKPRLVRIGSGDDYRWTSSVQPAYASRYIGNVEEVFSVPATSPALIFEGKNRISVRFPVGENLTLGKNTFANTIKTFGLWKYLNYEPADVEYLEDEDGKFIQIISLIRWRGVIFPRPEFGGVLVIRQQDESFMDELKRLIIGAGEWVRPEDVSKYNYLQRQNTVPFQVSRFIANSFRFHKGFFAPFPNYHRGDIRIPDQASDVNNQPFTTFFRFKDAKIESKLYHYFALEPYHPEKRGLNTSLFVPADGIGPTYAYYHYRHSEVLIGVSAVARKIKDSKKNYDWSIANPAENRPYFKFIANEIRVFWLTTIVTKQDSGDGNKEEFISGSVPDITILDARYKVPIWVNPLKPDSWDSQLEEELHGLWGVQKQPEKKEILTEVDSIKINESESIAPIASNPTQPSVEGVGSK